MEQRERPESCSAAEPRRRATSPRSRCSSISAPSGASPSCSGSAAPDADPHRLAVGGRAAIAAQVLGCFEALSEEAGGAEAWVKRENDETLAIIPEHIDDASFADALAKGRKLSPDEAMALGFDSDL